MRIKYLKWDSENTTHIWRHSIREKEIDELCKSKLLVRRGRDKRYIFWGKTFSGRYLFLVMRKLEKGIFRPITARDMNEREKRFYRKKVKQ